MPTDAKLAWTAAGALMALLLGTLVTVGMQGAREEDVLRRNEEQWRYIAKIEERVRAIELRIAVYDAARHDPRRTGPR